MKISNRRFCSVFVCLTILTGSNLQPSTVDAQGTSFSYQGQLNANGGPASGLYDFRFRLALDNQGNTYVGDPFLTNGISVSNGLFITSVNFGAGIFTGTNYWLEVDVRTNNPGNTLTYTVLSPLQFVQAAPYAIMANSASNLLGTIPAGQITGSVASANLSGTYGNVLTLDNPGNSFSGNGGGLTNVNAATLNGLNAGSLWQLNGNNITAGQFLGSTNNQPLAIYVNGARVLLLEPGGASVGSGTNTPTGAPSLLGGSAINYIAPGTVGAVIAGGGAMNWYGTAVPWSNSIAVGSDFSTISGGLAITIQASALGSTIGGGYGQSIQTNSTYGTISGGSLNSIGIDASFATIAGGAYNGIGSGSPESAIGGGSENFIYGDASQTGASVISGGYYNIIFTNAFCSFIGGGEYNSILGDPNDNGGTAIVGGVNNVIQTNAPNSFIGGGYGNSIFGDANDYGASVIVGGGYNTINKNSDHAFIGGGWYNFMGSNDYEGVIVGGYQNSMLNSAGYSFIGSGEDNIISTNTAHASVVGGYNNVIGTNAEYSFIGGGLNNTIYGDNQNYGTSVIVGGDADIAYPGSFNSFIGGGQNNTIGTNADHSTIAGGINNSISTGAYQSFAAGAGTKVNNNNSFVWGDGSTTTSSSAGNSVTFRASGGYRFFTGSGSGGATLAAGATSWTTLSDRNAKKDFAPLDAEEVLEKLAQVPVEQWHYKWEKDSDTMNIGPMAQDFKHTFYPGRDDKGITTLEFDGVELAAIKGLNQKLEDRSQKLETENAELKHENDMLAARLDELAQAVKTLAEKNDAK